MGIFSDVWDALTGKAAKERRRAKQDNEALERELSELRTEGARLETEKSGLVKKKAASKRKGKGE